MRSGNASSLLVLFLAVAIDAQLAVVGVTASDVPSLQRPTARDQALTVEQVEAMVRRSVGLAGGLAEVIPDTARLVVLKPNVVTPQASGSGVVTDTRVVRAVALLVHEVAPAARILIAEGSGNWVSPAFRDCVDVPDARVADGFEAAGHRKTAAELRALGINIECFDLNFDRVLTLHPPTGGLSMPEYDLAATIIEADAWINIPVAKAHGTKITCSLKNQFGLLPGIVYGFDKSSGTENHRGIPHAPRVMDETFVDLLSLTEPDFNVVDMIAGVEGGAFEGEPKRSNVIVAGRDAIATDLVVAQLMGFNPDDFEFAPLGALHGIGPGSIDEVSVRGGQVAELSSRFKKATKSYSGEWSEHAGFGMGPRRWTLLGPVDAGHTFTPAQLRSLSPVPGRDDWSAVVRFADDRIDLDKLYDDPTHCAVYAFTRFTMATSDSVRVWVGSDEDLQVWIDGELVHAFEGRRRHVLGGVRQPAFIEAGDHTLLIRAGQGRGRFDFSINICEPIDDILYAGNRYPGVRYYLTSPDLTDSPSRQIAADHVREDGLAETYFASNMAQADPVSAWRAAPDSILLDVMPQPRWANLMEAARSVSDGNPTDLDSATASILSHAPFQFGYLHADGWFYRQELPPGRLLNWLGLRHDTQAGYQYRESIRSVHGWLSLGHVPLLGIEDDWRPVTGIRSSAEQTQLRFVGVDTTYWETVSEDWWGQFPGNRWQNCPIIVVERDGPSLGAAAIADSVAGLLLHYARLNPYVDKPQSWGERPFPGGLAGWDTWVDRWARMPLSAEWLQSNEWARQKLSTLRGGWSLAGVAEWRRELAGYFALVGERLHEDRRRSDLQAASRAYGEVAVQLEAIIEVMPERDSVEWSAEDDARSQGLAGTLGMWHTARDAERTALGALAHMLGEDPLPPRQDEPPSQRDGSIRLLTWRAAASRAAYDVTLQGDRLVIDRLVGSEPEGAVQEILATLPESGHWRIVVEAAEGYGIYQALQVPSAANGWTTIVRIDDTANHEGPTELTVWAIPDPL